MWDDPKFAVNRGYLVIWGRDERENVEGGRSFVIVCGAKNIVSQFFIYV